MTYNNMKKTNGKKIFFITFILILLITVFSAITYIFLLMKKNDGRKQNGVADNFLQYKRAIDYFINY